MCHFDTLFQFTYLRQSNTPILRVYWWWIIYLRVYCPGPLLHPDPLISSFKRSSSSWYPKLNLLLLESFVWLKSGVGVWMWEILSLQWPDECFGGKGLSVSVKTALMVCLGLWFWPSKGRCGPSFWKNRRNYLDKYLKIIIIVQKIGYLLEKVEKLHCIMFIVNLSLNWLRFFDEL